MASMRRMRLSETCGFLLLKPYSNFEKMNENLKKEKKKIMKLKLLKLQRDLG
jgi:hypothetical protein